MLTKIYVPELVQMRLYDCAEPQLSSCKSYCKEDGKERKAVILM